MKVKQGRVNAQAARPPIQGSGIITHTAHRIPFKVQV